MPLAIAIAAIPNKVIFSGAAYLFIIQIYAWQISHFLFYHLHIMVKNFLTMLIRL